MALVPKDDSIPAFVGPHEDQEFDLMTAGEKHLSMFVFEASETYEDYPDRRFEAAVGAGKLIKDERIEQRVLPGNSKMSLRIIMYATPREAWRIPAMRMVQEIYHSTGVGWRPDLERMIGSLLGYKSADVEAFIERVMARKNDA